VNAIEGDCPGFAINTADAVSSGTMHMLAAGLIEACNSAKERLGDNMKLIITGGMAEKVMPYLNTIKICHEPHIVLHGLFYASEQ
jgi:pantothenate kinase type III